MRYLPESGDTWTTGSRVIRFRLAGAEFLDPSTCKLGFTLYNQTKVTTGGAAASMTPIAPPLAMFSRLRLYVAGVLCEDITEVGALTMLLERMKPAARRLNDSMEAHPMTGATLSDENYAPMAGGTARKVLVDLPFGILKQDRWMPLAQIAI